MSDPECATALFVAEIRSATGPERLADARSCFGGQGERAAGLELLDLLDVLAQRLT